MEGKRVPLMGVHFDEELKLKKWWKIHGNKPKTREEVLLGNEVAIQLFKSTGDTLSINGRPVKIAGVLDETGSQDDFLIFADLAFVQEVTKKPEASEPDRGLGLLQHLSDRGDRPADFEATAPCQGDCHQTDPSDQDGGLGRISRSSPSAYRSSFSSLEV